MPEQPIAGWYADPADSSQHRYWNGEKWTGRTRSATGAAALRDAEGSAAGSLAAAEAGKPFGGDPDSSPGMLADTAPQRRAWVLPVAVVGGLAVLGIVTGVVLANAKDKPSTSPTTNPFAPTEVATLTPSKVGTEADVVAPEGWSTATSVHGGFAFAYDPAWQDVNEEIGYAELFEQQIESAGGRADIGGVYMLNGDFVSGGDSIQIVAFTDGNKPRFLETQLQAALAGATSDPAIENVETLREWEVTTPFGLTGNGIEYTASGGGVTVANIMVIVADEANYYMVLGYFDEGAQRGDLVDQVVDSIVSLGAIAD